MSNENSKNTAATDSKNDSENTDNLLNAIEKKQLRSAETSIRNGLKAYQNVGKALTIISQGRLYRQSHSTMAKYAREKWDMTTARVAQLCHAYRVHELLTSVNISPMPTTESQCRPLARIPQDENMDSVIIQVWTAVIETGEKITAKLVNDEVDKALGIEPKQAADSAAGDTAGTAAGTADSASASAEQRAEIRDLKKKIAYLESALEAEKKAHQRTQAAGGVPRSKVAKELFKRGFRAMAKECHPDHGGSDQKMAELNKVKDALNI